MKNWAIYCFLLVVLVSCTEDNGPQLPSVEERVAEAVGNLTGQLTAPGNGWRIDYTPTPGTGSFLVLLDFNDDGTVRIQSDVIANDGEFRDQTIPYRIDNAQGLELILETYGVFHFLFERQQATFGGEFEFLFVGEQEGGLIFSSKSDATLPENTVLVFQEASGNDANLISTEALPALNRGIFQTPDLAGIGNFAPYNIYLENANATISTTIDLDNRRIKLHGIASGRTQEEVLGSTNRTSINSSSTFTVENEVVFLDDPQSVRLGLSNFNISRIPVQNVTESTISYCNGRTESIVQMSSDNVTGLGDITLESTLFQTHSSFQPDDEDFYNINYIFIYDQDDNSIADEIEAIYPDVVAFQWYYGLSLSDGSTLNAVGFITVDDLNNADFFLREFNFSQSGNAITLNFTGENFITDDEPTDAEIAGLEAITDQIFGDGEVFIIETITTEDIFEFFNPCNGYKGFLLKS